MQRFWYRTCSRNHKAPYVLVALTILTIYWIGYFFPLPLPVPMPEFVPVPEFVHESPRS